jgi:hypothetical protein
MKWACSMMSLCLSLISVRCPKLRNWIGYITAQIRICLEKGPTLVAQCSYEFKGDVKAALIEMRLEHYIARLT